MNKPESPTKNPIQPLYIDEENIVRFKSNAIVQYLIEICSSNIIDDVNSINFSIEDLQQFAQLIGYSLYQYADLPYVSDEAYNEAEKMTTPDIDNYFKHLYNEGQY